MTQNKKMKFTSEKENLLILGDNSQGFILF